MQHRSPFLRHLAVIGVAALITVPAYHFSANASVGPAPEPHGDWTERLQAAVTGSDYDLSRLRLLNRTIYFVDDKYVEPSRIDPEAMFEAALDRVERRVPEVLFRREAGSNLLHVSVGEHSTALELPEIRRTADMVDQLQRVAAVLQHRLSDEVAAPEVEYAMINGVLSTLDPHSVLLPPEASREMDVDNAGEFGGLGISINTPEGRLTIIKPMEDTPAARAGLKAGDLILRIDGESTVNMDVNEAASRMRGPVGEPVTLLVKREGVAENLEFIVVRAKIKIKEVEGELLEGGVGYARIPSFHATVSTDLVNVLARLRRENDGQELRGLVLDLRGNPGGFLHQAIEVSDLFLSSGGIVSTVERGDRRVESRQASRMGTQPEYPLVVLVDAGSASASEIVAGALVNNGRAVIVGERTFGKGSVQNLYKNTDDSQLKLTVAKYLTPNDKSIQSVGIPADILLKPAVVTERMDKETGQAEPLVALRHREYVSREVDLDHHMEWAEGGGGQSVYELSFLKDIDDTEEEGEEPDLSHDWEVQFSRDLLLAAPDDANRAEVLASVGSVIATYERREHEHIQQAFSTFGVDWSQGQQPLAPSLDVQLDLGKDGVLKAGAANAETLSVRVTNTGDAPVYQVMAVADSSFDWMDHREFFFGELAPGETRVWPMRVALHEGYRSSVGEVSLKLQDAARTPLGESEHVVEVVGQELPRLTWTWSLSDAGEGAHGDGDGVAEPGEVVAMEVVVRNEGAGVAPEAFARLKNEAGRALDLEVGAAELGALKPGETATARFLFKVMGGEPELPVELRVGDQAAYDHAAVWRAGFYDNYVTKLPIVVPVGKPLPSGSASAPTVEITRGPSLNEDEVHQVISGMARDDHGVRDVLIYHKAEGTEDKLYFRSGGVDTAALPFSSEVELKPGDNLFVIMVRDTDGLSSVRSVSVWHNPDHGGPTASTAKAE
ncbi:MAG: PDZ domain-containing protein [Alphaproteobacteria bacterium]|nr:PDZ domain-containing protein [Alphaproteobacteria bacterium]